MSTRSVSSDARLLTTVAGSIGVALENARLFEETQRLLRETEQRTTELAAINSIQQGIAAQVDFAGIIDLVGDSLRESLGVENIGISWFDESSGLLHVMYAYERGVRLDVPPRTACSRRKLRTHACDARCRS